MYILLNSVNLTTVKYYGGRNYKTDAHTPRPTIDIHTHTSSVTIRLTDYNYI